MPWVRLTAASVFDGVGRECLGRRGSAAVGTFGVGLGRFPDANGNEPATFEGAIEAVVDDAGDVLDAGIE